MDVDEIKRETFEAIKRRDVIVLVRSDYGWDVHEWNGTGGVYPSTSYDTAQEAGARALQLLGLTEPITPQNWPETIGIGPNPGAPPKPTPQVI